MARLNIAIVGSGVAGCISALWLYQAAYNERDVKITMYHDPTISIEPVGQGTTPGILKLLFVTLGQTWYNNVVKAKNLFNWCRDYDVRLLYASSSAVDGPYWNNPYAMSKWVNEQMAPPNSAGMRFTTVYGPDSRDNMMYGMLKDGTAPYVTNHRRDWIHVKDVCRAIRYLSSSTICGPVPVGYGESIPVRKLAEAFGQPDLPVKEYTPGEAEDNVADISIMLSTGWFPTINILDTIDADV